MSLRLVAAARSLWGAAWVRQHAVALAVLAGAMLLVWPALVNGYPILFTDTHAFLVQAGQPRMVWDKPFTYGPFLRLFHEGVSLWLPLAAQGLILSHLLWLTAKALGQARAGGHLLLCAVLAAGSAAPWFVSLLMPDIFAPVTVLCLFLLGFGVRLSTRERAWVGVLATAAIAFHLTHLIIAAACIAAGLLLRPGRRTLRMALPLLAALAVLVLTNAVGFGRFGVSPFGAVFALARLVGDGPAAAVIRRSCPQAGWHICAFAARLPTDSDDFMWNPQGPVWTAPGGPERFAAEAGTIVARTLREEPLWVARTALANTLRQLPMVRLGDVLKPDGLETSVTGSLRAYFPPAEMDRFHAALQANGRLEAVAAPLNPAQGLLLLAAALATAWQLGRALHAHGGRGADPTRAALPALVLAALLANAFACGALSGPHHRYQARIAWLVLLPPLLPRLVRRPAAFPRPPGSFAPASRSRPAASG